jgi:hypothetical protein
MTRLAKVFFRDDSHAKTTLALGTIAVAVLGFVMVLLAVIAVH